MDYLTEVTVLELFLAAFFGAIFGSYATLFAYRLPINESCFGRYFGVKSRCPQCNATIKTRDLIPVLNWLFTLGRCRSCQTKIPRTHFFIELSTTLMFVVCYLKFSFSEEFLIYAMISVGLIILIATDFTHKTFPDAVLNFVLIFSLVHRVLIDQTITNAVFSSAVAVILATIFYQVFYRKAHGLFASKKQSFDYTKFILLTGAALPLDKLLFYFLAVMIILTLILILDVPTKKNRNSFGYVFIIPFFWLLIQPPIL
jgi:prepilin signal peptidase PulO-like enzyme (type II secretory pathway)